MPTIAVNDTTLHYERSGSGPPLLFVHGMCGDAEVWADQARRLSERFTCVRYDRRGHSRSRWGTAPVSYALHADDTAALIEALGLAPCLLVGSSGGAVVAVDVARRHGHLLRGAVFSEPPLFSLDPQAGAAVMAELAPAVERAAAEGGPARGVDAFFSLMCPGLWSILDEARKDRYRANADIGFADLRGPAVAIGASELAGVTVAALVVAGTTSHPSLRSVAAQLAAALPDGRLLELEGSGHVTYAERPAEFAVAVAAFAAELDRRAPSAGSRR